MRRPVMVAAHALVGERGQMCVEMAVLLPVTLVIALAVLNLARYAELCARFDRVALDAVVACGASPSGAGDASSSSVQVEARIQEAFADVDRLEVSVTSSEVGRLSGADATFSILPTLTRYTCEMRLSPWPSSFAIAGVSLGPPARLVHRRSLVVDRFRAGVVV